jgi:hypothetical protein
MVDAGRHGATGIFRGDAPQVSQPEGIGLRTRHGGIVQVVAVFIEVVEENLIILPAKYFQKGFSGFWDIDLLKSLFIQQPFARCALVGAKPGIRLQWSAIRMERKHIYRNGSDVFILRAGVNAVQNRIQVEIAEQAHIRNHDIDRNAPLWSDRQALQEVFIQRKNTLSWANLLDNFGKISRQNTRPTKGIHRGVERACLEFLKTKHPLDAGVFRWVGCHLRKIVSVRS